MKHYFLLGVILSFLFSVPVRAQKQTTILSSKEAHDLANGSKRSGIGLYRYYNVAYYYLGQNKLKLAERHFKKAEKYIKTLKKDYRFSTTKAVEEEEQRLRFEADNLQIKDYVTNASPVIKSEIDLYKSIVEKSYAKSVILVKEAKSNDFTLLRHIMNEKIQSKKLKKLVSEHGALKKRKIEFETQQEFKKRLTRYVALESQITRKHQERSRNIGLSFKEALSACSKHKSKMEKRTKTNTFIKKYPPKLKSHNEARVKSMEYNAEKEMFTLVLEIQDDKQSYKYNKKRYKIRVLRSQAPLFKKRKESNQYLFFLQDLRAVISRGKTYLIEPIHTWYTKLDCDKGVEEPILLLNGKPSTEKIEDYLLSYVRNDETFMKANKNAKPSYGDGFSDDYKKIRISVSFDEKGNVSNCEVDYPFKSSYGLVYNSFANNKPLKELGYKIQFIFNESNIKIIPQKINCQPRKTGVSFFLYPGQ